MSLFAKESGEGDPLIFLHGYCETHKVWLPFAELFSKQFKVFLVDLPGFGKSDLPQGTLSIDQVANLVFRHLNDRRVSRAIVIGHSLGGYVALALAESHPEILSAFVLFHSTTFADSEEKKENRNKVADFVRRNGTRPFTDTLIPGLFADKSHPALTEQLRISATTKPETVIAYALAMRDRPDRSHLLKSPLPKLILAGGKDTTVPIETSRKMSEMALNATFFELSESAHMGMYEQQELSQKTLETFAKRVFLRKSI